MEIDTKTAVIVILGVLLVFALFQLGGTKTSGSSTGAAVSSASYGDNPSYTPASRARTVNDLPAVAGGC
ncbi:Uncharacterised protein [uncultured archaeon]|nr:Uncharacterised protein [uncultured archaeon]